MEEEKKVESKDEKKEIIVLDAGISGDGPRGVCCIGTYFPIRGG